MKQDKWAIQLREKLADYEEPAPEGLWAGIEAALQATDNSREAAGTDDAETTTADPPVQEVGNRKARLVILRRWAAAASLTLLLTAGGYWLWRSDSPGSDRLTATIAPVRKDAQEAQDIPPEESEHIESDASYAGTMTQEPRRPTKGAKVGTDTSYAGKADDGNAKSTDVPVRNEESIDVPVTNDKSQDVSVTNDESKDVPITNDRSKVVPRKLPRRQPEKRQRSVSLNLFASNGFGTRTDASSVMMSNSMARTFSDTFSDGNTASSRAQPIFLSGYEEQQHHRQPLSFGLTMGYALTPGLTVVTGVTYTRLSSSFTYIMRELQVEKEQTLHYIGIPLEMNYRLWSYNRLKAYVNAGIEANWNIKARLQAEGATQPMDRDRMQWSVNGSLGLQYDITTHVGLYAEPGVRHYFDNGSNVQNFFKDKPTAFSLQMGLRLNMPF